jgi:hypothetical protein
MLVLQATVAHLELLDLAADGVGEIDAEGVREQSDADHDVREFPAEAVPAVPTCLLPPLILERAENLRVQLPDFLAELDRLREREVGVAVADGRIEAEVRGEAARRRASPSANRARSRRLMSGVGVVSGVLIAPFQARSAQGANRGCRRLGRSSSGGRLGR